MQRIAVVHSKFLFLLSSLIYQPAVKLEFLKNELKNIKNHKLKIGLKGESRRGATRAILRGGAK